MRRPSRFRWAGPFVAIALLVPKAWQRPENSVHVGRDCRTRIPCGDAGDEMEGIKGALAGSGSTPFHLCLCLLVLSFVGANVASVMGCRSKSVMDLGWQALNMNARLER